LLLVLGVIVNRVMLVLLRLLLGLEPGRVVALLGVQLHFMPVCQHEPTARVLLLLLLVLLVGWVPQIAVCVHGHAAIDEPGRPAAVRVPVAAAAAAAVHGHGHVLADQRGVRERRRLRHPAHEVAANAK